MELTALLDIDELIRLKRHEISLRKFYAWPGPAKVHLKPMSGVELNHANNAVRGTREGSYSCMFTMDF